MHHSGSLAYYICNIFNNFTGGFFGLMKKEQPPKGSPYPHFYRYYAVYKFTGS